MRLVVTFILLTSLALCVACAGERNSAPQSQQIEMMIAPGSGTAPAPNEAEGKSDAKATAALPANAGLNDKGAALPAIERKIIRNAELTLQTDQPDEGLRRITAAAEARGGFVVTSEATQRGANAGRNVKVIARVPSAQFNEFLAEVRQNGARVLSERITGQDVTEEFIDLEARLRVQKETETRYLDFLKQAKNVTDALTVQAELAKVRTVIEQIEGRKRFLESQSSLSTITVNLESESSAVVSSPGGFWYDVKKAFGDGLDAAATLILFLIRFVIVLLPITLLVFLPLGLLIRWLVRRARRPKTVTPPEV